jgi:hypothetical protein
MVFLSICIQPPSAKRTELAARCFFQAVGIITISAENVNVVKSDTIGHLATRTVEFQINIGVAGF